VGGIVNCDVLVENGKSVAEVSACNAAVVEFNARSGEKLSVMAYYVLYKNAYMCNAVANEAYARLVGKSVHLSASKAVYVSYVPIVSQKGAAVNVFCVDAANALVSNRSVEIFTRQTQAVFPNFSVLADNVLVF
jgi:hypothetical protein